MRYKLIVEYDGTGFIGWQKQKTHSPTCSIEGALEKAVYGFCRKDVPVVASGRTDAGVHATGQVVHVDLPKEYDIHNVRSGINFYLKKITNQISVIEAYKTTSDFHARFSAIQRHYRYIILDREVRSALQRGRVWHIDKPLSALDIEYIQQEASCLIGRHDFTSFRASRCQAKSPYTTITQINIYRSDETRNIYIEISARSFLYHMVRNIVGTLYQVLYDKKTLPISMHNILQAKDRQVAGITAPASGLYLTKVEY